MNYMKNIFFALFIALCSFVANAQQDSSTNITVVFDGDRRLFLRDATRLNVWPQTKDSIVEMTKIKYTTLPTPKAITIEPKLIPAAKINVEEKLPYLYKGYLKAGYGTYNTIPIDFYFSDGRSKKGTYGIHYQFLRGDGVSLNDKDSIPDRYSDNKAEIWGKWFIKKYQLLGKFNWDRNVSHWYGYNNKTVNEGPVFDSLQFDQRMNTFGGGLSFFTYERDTGDFNFRGDIYLRNTTDIRNNKETNFDILLHGRSLVDSTLYSMDVGVNWNGFKFFGPDISGKIENHLDTNVYDFQLPDKVYQNRNFDNAIIKFVPTASTTWRDLRAKIGAGLYIDARGSQSAHFYPLAELSYNLFHGIVVPYAGIRGNLEPTTYYGLYQLNPFVQPFPDLRNRNNKLDAYAGIGGAVSSTVSYAAGVNYFKWDDFAYFINDSLSSPADGYYTWGNQFTVLYDELSAINFHGELAYYAGEKWKGNIRVDYFNYTTVDTDHPWHQPALKLLANGQYNLKNKFIISTDLFYNGARWAKSLVPVEGVTQAANGSYEYKLKGFLDANFRVEYRYNKRLSAWLQLNNAFALKYQRWGAYNNQQLVAMLGASYSF